MTTINAYCFLALGTAMNLLPLLAPGAFPGGIDGANTSALWLQLMGWVNGMLGASYVARLEVLPFVVQVLTWRPALPPAIKPAELLRPAMEFYEEIEEELEAASAELRPVPVKRGRWAA